MTLVIAHVKSTVITISTFGILFKKDYFLVVTNYYDLRTREKERQKTFLKTIISSGIPHSNNNVYVI